MDDITEEFFSGFCRTLNASNSVCCEYTDGHLTWMDCAHKDCLHHAACEIYKEAHAYERKQAHNLP